MTAFALAPITAWSRAATSIAQALVDAWSGGMRGAVTAPVTAWSQAATRTTRAVLRVVLPTAR